jgi:hypothetical protein
MIPLTKRAKRKGMIHQINQLTVEINRLTVELSKLDDEDDEPSLDDIFKELEEDIKPKSITRSLFNNSVFDSIILDSV